MRSPVFALSRFLGFFTAELFHYVAEYLKELITQRTQCDNEPYRYKRRNQPVLNCGSAFFVF